MAAAADFSHGTSSSASPRLRRLCCFETLGDADLAGHQVVEQRLEQGRQRRTARLRRRQLRVHRRQLRARFLAARGGEGSELQGLQRMFTPRFRRPPLRRSAPVRFAAFAVNRSDRTQGWAWTLRRSESDTKRTQQVEPTLISKFFPGGRAIARLTTISPSSAQELPSALFWSTAVRNTSFRLIAPSLNVCDAQGCATAVSRS